MPSGPVTGGEGSADAEGPVTPPTPAKTFHREVFYAMIALVVVCFIVGAIFIGAGLGAYYSLTSEGSMIATAAAIGEAGLEAFLYWQLFFVYLAVTALWCAPIVLLMAPMMYS